jgi:Rrf2 family iron-sulfur cluster assembly transcriptional regulator
MILSQTAEYALRCMAVLAGLWPDERVTAKDLAERANVPAAYASKVMRKLVVAGLVDALRGHHGGFLLTRDPATVPLFDVLQAIDFEVHPSECAFGIGRCSPRDPCPLHDVWTDLQQGFEDWARTTTLSETAARAPWTMLRPTQEAPDEA